jgi:F-type H+-transporting ATPase subunit a
MNVDPLHQFLINPILSFSVSGINLSFTNSALFMTLVVSVIFILFYLTLNSYKVTPGRLQMCVELVFSFVRDTVKSSIGKEGMVHFPLILSIFLFILLGNLFGMIPFAFTFTSHIAVTFSLALVVFIVALGVDISHKGMGFFGRFLPPGVPALMIPVIVPVEVLSFVFRPISLSVRLFANMLAGHIILKIFAGCTVMMGFFGFIPLAFNVVFMGFECFVAVLQAYIFTVLSCAYLNDALHSH